MDEPRIIKIYSCPRAVDWDLIRVDYEGDGGVIVMQKEAEIVF
jgi:hypothetical protein